MIEVLRPGALTTVQDLGRPGHAASGVPRGGAFDPVAARAANRRVGNPPGAALLEITLAGPTLRFGRAVEIALAGDPFDVRVDGDAAEIRRERLPLKEGALLEVGRARAGVRTWLAVAGGIDVPLVLGSRATDLAGGFGGHEGRALRAGDRLSVFPSPELFPPGSEEAPDEPASGALRLVAGPDGQLLEPGESERLAAIAWRVDPRSDRRGVRLSGGTLTLRPHPPLRSQPMLPGAVELTPAGEPIVLGVDAPVTGGYPWVAQVVEGDLRRLAHLAPGAPVRFAWTTLAAAGAR
jgi:biotin-dependent carboxylase-like uncharacterized protein